MFLRLIMEPVKEKWHGYLIHISAMHPGEVDAMGCVTGKPVTQGGVRGRKEATGLGVFYGVREVCNMPDVMQKIGLPTGVEGKRVIVQGLGNVGYHTAKFFREHGAKVIAIAEFEGAIFNENGLNEEEVFQHRKQNKSILNFPGAKNIRKQWRCFGTGVRYFNSCSA